MTKDDFLSKSKDLLGDRSTYYPVRTNPLKMISKRVDTFCTKLFEEKIITENQKFHILSHAFRLPQIFCLPKVHKENTPFRPLVDGTGSHLHYLAKYLFKQIQHEPHSSTIKIPWTLPKRSIIL